MSVLSVAVKHLIAAGVTGDALVRAIEEMEAAIDTRSTGAKRQARYRQNLKERNEASQSVTRDDSDDLPPALDKEIPPTPPKEINLTPRAVSVRALARKAGGFGPPDGVDLVAWNEFCGQRRKPITRQAYARMLNTLTETTEAGWPPGEIVGRSIERGWETLFVPNEAKNGKRTSNHSGEDAFMVAAAEVAFGGNAGHGGPVVHLLTGRAGSAGR